MSLKTWKEKFYPITAKQAAKRSALFAAKHSLKKWLGLKQEILRSHGGEVLTFGRDSGDLRFPLEGAAFEIDSKSCSLCVKFKYRVLGNPCAKCPLAIVRGGVACDERMDEEEDSPFVSWLRGRDPEPMIRWLRKTVKMLENKGGRKK